MQEGPSNNKELAGLREQLKAAQAEAKVLFSNVVFRGGGVFLKKGEQANEGAAAEARKLKMDVASLKTSVGDLQERNSELETLLSLKTGELQSLTER